MSSLSPAIRANRAPERLALYSRGAYLAAVRPLPAEGFDSGSTLDVITLHGMVESAGVWSDIAGGLAPNFRAGYVLDLPWHNDDGCLWGLEATPDEWVEPLLDALPPGGKVVLAHSFGANALLALLNRRSFPDIRALVLLSPYYKPSFESFDWALFHRYVNEFDAFLEQSIRIRHGGDRIHPESVTAIAEKIKDTYSSFSWVQFFVQFSKTPALDLDRMHFPTLVIGGDQDLSIPISDLEVLASSLPRSRLSILSRCGHFGMIESPMQLSRIICDFINDIKES